MRLKGVLIVAIVLIVISFIFTMASCERIDAGHEGIRVNMYGDDRGVQDVSLVTGMVWYNPFTQKIVEFPIYVETFDYEAFTVNAKDGSVFEVDPTISLRVIAGQSPHIYSKYRRTLEEIAQTTLLNYIKDAFRIQMNKYTTDEIISNRERFESSVQNTLDTFLLHDGFEREQLTSGLKTFTCCEYLQKSV